MLKAAVICRLAPLIILIAQQNCFNVSEFSNVVGHSGIMPAVKVCMIDAGMIQAFGTLKSIFNEEKIRCIYGKMHVSIGMVELIFV